MMALPQAVPASRGVRVGPSLAVRLLGLAIGVSLLLLAPASAGQVDGESCPSGAISAVGPVDAQGKGDTTPDVACIVP